MVEMHARRPPYHFIGSIGDWIRVNHGICHWNRALECYSHSLLVYPGSSPVYDAVAYAYPDATRCYWLPLE